MDIWSANKLIFFIAFFIPGFISIKIYDLLLPTERREASQTIIEAITYSCLNYAVMSWAIYLDLHLNLSSTHPVWHGLFLLLVLVFSPLLLAFGYYKLRKTELVSKLIPHPITKPWDYVFGKRESYWIIIEFLDGTKIGGIYDTDSFASSFPSEEQIYLQQVWEIEDRRFIKPVERSKGIIVDGNNIKSIEFFI